MVRIKERPEPASSAAPAARPEPFIGVEDWIYFRADSSSTALAERTRIALGELIQRRVDRGLGPKKGENEAPRSFETRLIEAICEAIMQDDWH